MNDLRTAGRGQATSTGAWPAVVLTGPTAAGKTALAIHLAERGPFDVISVDSAMIYRGMDIGTAKPDPEVLARVPHALVDICDPAQAYSAGRFVEDALGAMERSRRVGRVPLLIGGTALYLKALQRGLAPLPTADGEMRARLDAQALTEGWPALHRELAGVDPAAAARIHPNDAQRIQRALEVWHLTGTPLSVLQDATEAPSRAYTYLKYAVMPADRATLHERIEQRLAQMLAAGLVEEVAELFARGDLNERMPSMRSVNYRQYWRHLKGEHSAAQAGEAAVQATRQLAKRQLTWLRADSAICWLDSDSPSRYTSLMEKVESALEEHQV
ncbi:MAG: tRNA (adenosine(37)-N6)-dimethylallyltransferase MiaA [Pseudomonadota bacterium]